MYGLKLGLAGWFLLILLTTAYATPGSAQSAAQDRDGRQDDLAQFQLPPATGKPGSGTAKPPALPRRLKYEYGYGSESEVTYRRNADLDRSISDDVAFVTPEINGHLIYRPNDWLETTLELIMERPTRIHGDQVFMLPDGDFDNHPDDRASLLVDQAFFKIHNVISPFSVSLGRRNYEDERHWLYDTSLDIGAIGLKLGRFQLEATYGREVYVDLDVFKRQEKDRVNTFMLYGDYRALEDVKVAAYVIRRDDRINEDGRWTLYGLRSIGAPAEGFNYWVEVALIRGRDEDGRDLRGYGFDVGATYRFFGVPFNPALTVAFAYGSGDSGSEDGTNGEFRQTGVHSNEQKFSGLSEFLYYGEALDPELSNIKILTIGLGFRPWRDMSLDLVYHRYWLNVIAEELRDSALTALMNQDSDRMSRDIGEGIDVVIGFRNVLGIRRLGIDLRMGLFLPGDAFRNSLPDDSFERADIGGAVVAKIWY